MQNKRLRVLIADDYAPITLALDRVVSMTCDVVGKLADGTALLDETKRLQPDILLLDLNLPNVNSLVACAEIRRTMPATKVIVLTGGLDPLLRGDVLAAGASAFLDKGAAPELLLAAMDAAQQSCA